MEVKGFTLVELLVGVLLVGTLATLILPRYLNLHQKAELSEVRATASAFKSAVNLVKLSFAMQGYNTRVQNLPHFGSNNVDTNNIGFPIGIDKGNGNENIGRGNAGCQGVWEGILNTSSSVSTGSLSDYQAYRHTSNRVCSYVYRKNGDSAGRNTAALVIQYDSRDGSVYVCGMQPDVAACPF